MTQVGSAKAAESTVVPGVFTFQKVSWIKKGKNRNGWMFAAEGSRPAGQLPTLLNTQDIISRRLLLDGDREVSLLADGISAYVITTSLGHLHDALKTDTSLAFTDIVEELVYRDLLEPGEVKPMLQLRQGSVSIQPFFEAAERIVDLVVNPDHRAFMHRELVEEVVDMVPRLQIRPLAVFASEPLVAEMAMVSPPGS